MEKVITLIALTALTVVEHNGVKYGPGQDAGANFEANELEAAPLLQVKAVKLYDPSASAQDAVSIGQASAASEAADAALQAASEAQAKADADAKDVVQARAKLEADIKAFEKAKAAADAVGAKTAKK